MSRAGVELADHDLALAEHGPVAGVDEAGRGCLAGPVTAGAVILPPGWAPSGLDDSKRLSARRRENSIVRSSRAL